MLGLSILYLGVYLHGVFMNTSTHCVFLTLCTLNLLGKAFKLQVWRCVIPALFPCKPAFCKQ